MGAETQVWPFPAQVPALQGWPALWFAASPMLESWAGRPYPEFSQSSVPASAAGSHSEQLFHCSRLLEPRIQQLLGQRSKASSENGGAAASAWSAIRKAQPISSSCWQDTQGSESLLSSNASEVVLIFGCVIVFLGCQAVFNYLISHANFPGIFVHPSCYSSN